LKSSQLVYAVVTVAVHSNWNMFIGETSAGVMNRDQLLRLKQILLKLVNPDKSKWK